MKVPFSAAALETTRALVRDGIRVNMTLVFSAAQALLSAEAGATYVSCFIGRLDDVGIDGVGVLGEIATSFGHGERPARLLAASIRSPLHVVAAARIGCDVATVPVKVLRQMLEHPLTAAGIERFRTDWESEPKLGRWLARLVGGEAVAA